MSRKSQDNLSTAKTGWEMAVFDAEEMVRAARSRLEEAEAVLVICKDRRDKGEPWLGLSLHSERDHDPVVR